VCAELWAQPCHLVEQGGSSSMGLGSTARSVPVWVAVGKGPSSIPGAAQGAVNSVLASPTLLLCHPTAPLSPTPQWGASITGCGSEQRAREGRGEAEGAWCPAINVANSVLCLFPHRGEPGAATISKTNCSGTLFCFAITTHCGHPGLPPRGNLSEDTSLPGGL